MIKCKLFAITWIIVLISCSCVRQGVSNLNGSDQTKKSSETATSSIKDKKAIEQNGNGQTKKSSETATSSIKDKTAIEQMEIAFVGGFRKEEIKTRLDKAMELYGLAITEENYSRAGSTLVGLRQKNGTREMDILSYMIRSHVPGVKMHFADAAGISSAMLVLGEK